jgi:glycosyltransferase involved in cell wall biosynthesis
MNPEVSIVIPFHNRIDLLVAAVRSVFAQTFRDFEVILVDDRSDAYSLPDDIRNDPRVKLFRNEGGRGPAAARNLGIERSSGRYVAFLDSDDTFLPDKLEKQLGFMDRSEDIVFSHTSYYRVDTTGARELVPSGTFHGRVYPRMLFGCPIATPTVMVRGSLLKKEKFDEKYHLGEDVILWAKIARGHNINGIDEPLTVVSVNAKSASQDRKKQTKGLYNIFSFFYKYDGDLGFGLLLKSALAISYSMLPQWLKKLRTCWRKHSSTGTS